MLRESTERAKPVVVRFGCKSLTYSPSLSSSTVRQKSLIDHDDEKPGPANGEESWELETGRCDSHEEGAVATMSLATLWAEWVGHLCLSKGRSPRGRFLKRRNLARASDYLIILHRNKWILISH